MKMFDQVPETEDRVIILDDPRDFLVWRKGSGRSVEIFDIAVGSERRKGKGRKLIELLIDRICPTLGAKKVFAITSASNFIAQQFYEELRFRSIPLRNFYEVLDKTGAETVDAIMYIRDIGSQA